MLVFWHAPVQDHRGLAVSDKQIPRAAFLLFLLNQSNHLVASSGHPSSYTTRRKGFYLDILLCGILQPYLLQQHLQFHRSLALGVGVSHRHLQMSCFSTNPGLLPSLAPMV